MKTRFSKSGFTVIEIAIIVVLLVAIGGVWYYSFQNKTNNPTDIETPVTLDTTATDEAVITNAETKTDESKDETADWKTYTNAQYSFSVKHPQNWFTTENFGRGVYFSDKTYKIVDGTGDHKSKYLDIIVEKDNTVTDPAKWFGGENTVISSSKIDRDGRTFYYSKIKGNIVAPHIGNGEIIELYSTNQNNNAYIFIAYTDINQLISTFKFTN